MKECEQCNALRHQRALGHPECDREDGVWIPHPGAELWGGEQNVPNAVWGDFLLRDPPNTGWQRWLSASQIPRGCCLFP